MTNDFAVSFNWNRHQQMHSLIRPVPDTLRHMLTLLDGAHRGIISLWHIVPGTSERIGFSAWPSEFLQSAGTADAMSIELRRREADGEYHQYGVAKPTDEPGTRVVVWEGNDPARPHRLTLPANEVFTAAEAADVYAAYYATDEPPPGYRLREVNLDS